VMKNFMFLNVKFLLRLWYFNGNWIFSTVFQKILKNQILWSGIRIVTHGWTYILKVVVAFHIFANVHSDWNVGQCTCLCGICNKAYFVTKFCVNTETRFTGILDSVGASERDAAWWCRRNKSRLLPNMSKTRAIKFWYQGYPRMKPNY